MREIRDGITVEEAGKWMLEMEPNHYHGCIDLRIADLLNKKPRDDYPDSFYEDSPIGSFGKFRSDYSEADHYDYLAEINGRKYTDSHGFVWNNFTPGLPDDVDACGMPK